MYPAFPANGAAGPAVVAAAADIGSNTIKMSVATLTQSGVLPELATCSETVRLGTGPTTSGILAEDRMETALALLLGLLPQPYEIVGNHASEEEHGKRPRPA